MTVNLGPTLVRLCIDVAHDADFADASWDLATSLIDEMSPEEARKTAWHTTLFLAKLLAQLGTEHPDIDVDAIVAEWGLFVYAQSEDIEVAP